MPPNLHPQFRESIRICYKKLYLGGYKIVETVHFRTELYPAEDIIHEFFTIFTDGWMEIRAGYSFDGASGGIDTECFMRGACAHDVPYQANQLCLPLPANWKKVTDKLLVRLTREDGMWPIRCWWVYKSVSMFGRGRPRDLNEFDEIRISP
jgi:hypothetical protein